MPVMTEILVTCTQRLLVCLCIYVCICACVHVCVCAAVFFFFFCFVLATVHRSDSEWTQLLQRTNSNVDDLLEPPYLDQLLRILKGPALADRSVSMCWQSCILQLAVMKCLACQVDKQVFVVFTV